MSFLGLVKEKITLPKFLAIGWLAGWLEKLISLGWKEKEVYTNSAHTTQETMAFKCQLAGKNGKAAIQSTFPE